MGGWFGGPDLVGGGGVLVVEARWARLSYGSPRIDAERGESEERRAAGRQPPVGVWSAVVAARAGEFGVVPVPVRGGGGPSPHLGSPATMEDGVVSTGTGPPRRRGLGPSSKSHETY